MKKINPENMEAAGWNHITGNMDSSGWDYERNNIYVSFPFRRCDHVRMQEGKHLSFTNKVQAEFIGFVKSVEEINMVAQFMDRNREESILEEIEAVLRDRMRAATKVAGEKIDLANDLRDRGENYMEVYSESVAMVHYSQAYEAAAQIVSDFKNGARIDVVATAMNNPEVRDIMKTFGL